MEDEGKTIEMILFFKNENEMITAFSNEAKINGIYNEWFESFSKYKNRMSIEKSLNKANKKHRILIQGSINQFMILRDMV